jgi:Meckel syndrome type 1 protein
MVDRVRAELVQSGIPKPKLKDVLQIASSRYVKKDPGTAVAAPAHKPKRVHYREPFVEPEMEDEPEEYVSPPHVQRRAAPAHRKQPPTKRQRKETPPAVVALSAVEAPAAAPPVAVAPQAAVQPAVAVVLPEPAVVASEAPVTAGPEPAVAALSAVEAPVTAGPEPAVVALSAVEAPAAAVAQEIPADATLATVADMQAAAPAVEIDAK